METGQERREKLRSFLMYQRSRFSPAELGLPDARHRRVPGLRRQEVAELIGVSEDWYRWLESGRPVSVSPRLLARLSDRLHLNAYDRVTLYRLAFPELYLAETVTATDLPQSVSSNVITVSLPSEIDEARRMFDSERDAFLRSEPVDGNHVRTRILGSWKRSRSMDVDPSVMYAPLACPNDDAFQEVREQNRPLLDAAVPLLSHLANTLAGTGYAISLTDSAARVLQVGGDRDGRRRVERVGIVPGGDLSETAVGTNGIGTVLADRRPLQLMASEHFTEAGQSLTCTGAPIRSPGTDEVCGVLVVMSDYHLIRPALLPTVARYALEIEERLAKTEVSVTP